MSYVGEARFRFKGPADVCSRYIPMARVLVERVSAMYNIGGEGAADTATHTTALADGTTIRVTVFVQGPPIITIAAGEENYQKRQVSLDTVYMFYSTNPTLNTIGPWYEPGSVADAYNRLDDLTGIWRREVLPTTITPMLVHPHKAHYSLDLQPDGYPRYVTSWSGVTTVGIGQLSSTGMEPLSEYKVNGKTHTAPGPVIGAMKDKLKEVVYVANFDSGLAIDKHTKDTDDAWVLDWSSTVSHTDTPSRIANTMEFSPDETKALFAVQYRFDDDTYDLNDYMYYPVLFEIVLATGVITHVYGSKATFPARTESRRCTTTNTEFPDDTVYTWRLNSGTFPAGSVSTLSLTGVNGDTSTYRTVPRVGDEFWLLLPSVNANESCHIRVDAVTYTPEPQTLQGGETFTGSLNPHKANEATIDITWLKVGTGSDGTTPITINSNDMLHYVNPTGEVSADQVYEEEQTVDGEFLVSYGYDTNGVISYAVHVIDTEYTENFTTFSDAGNSNIQEDRTRTELDNSYIEYRGGEQNLLKIKTGNNCRRFKNIDGIENLVFATDSTAFSGYNYYTATGSLMYRLQEEVRYPVDVPIAAYSESAVYGASTDDVTRDTEVDIRIDEAATYTNDYGLVSYLQREQPAAAVTGASQSTAETTRLIIYSGAPTTETENIPTKDVYAESAWHNGVKQEDRLYVETYDQGAGSYSAVKSFSTGNTTRSYHHGANTYDAFPWRTRYTVDWYSNAFTPTRGVEGRIAADPLHNVVIGFTRDDHDSASMTIRRDGYGYVYRSDELDSQDANPDVLTLDPRTLFEDTPTVESATDLYWGVVITRVTNETSDVASEEEADSTIIRMSEPTYRLP